MRTSWTDRLGRTWENRKTRRFPGEKWKVNFDPGPIWVRSGFALGSVVLRWFTSPYKAEERSSTEFGAKEERRKSEGKAARRTGQKQDSNSLFTWKSWRKGMMFCLLRQDCILWQGNLSPWFNNYSLLGNESKSWLLVSHTYSSLEFSSRCNPLTALS